MKNLKLMVLMTLTLIIMSCGGYSKKEQREIFNGHTESEYREGMKQWGYSKAQINDGIKKMYAEHEKKLETEKLKDEQIKANALKWEKENEEIRSKYFTPHLKTLKELFKKYDILFGDVVLKEIYYFTEEGTNLKVLESANWLAFVPEQFEGGSNALGVENGILVYEDLDSFVRDLAQYQEANEYYNLKNSKEYMKFLEDTRTEDYVNKIKGYKIKF